MKKFAAIVIVILLGGCDWISENQICQVPYSELYGMAWEEQLDKNGIIFSKKDGKICYPEKYSVKARRASFSA
ncbi:MAG: hypothetical protein ABW139_02865 [Candidatus Thiodiazotropha sp. DIVDIV]